MWRGLGLKQPLAPAPHLRRRSPAILGRQPLRVLCGAGKRRAVIKRRDAPRSQKSKLKYRDEPRSLGLNPSDDAFLGRLTTEINSANGPLQLAKLVQEYGASFSGTQASMALARLAAFTTFESLTPEQLAAVARTARKCTLLVKQRMSECEPISYARTSYSLARLGIYDQGLFEALAGESQERLHLMGADSLAALLTGMALVGHRPSDEWLNRYCLEAYTRLSAFNGNELANMVYSLSRLDHAPSAAWLERCLELFRAAMRYSATPPSLVKYLYGIARLQARPSFNWMGAYAVEARSRIDYLTGRELASLLWAMARLGYGPDRVFMDAWYRCTTKRMGNVCAASAVLALQALAQLEAAPLPARYLRALMERAQALLPELAGPQLVSALLSLVALRVRPGAAWMEDCLAACQALLPEMSTAVLCELAWALGRLRYQPSPDFADALAARVERELPRGMSVQQLAVLAWAYGALQCAPPAALMDALRAAAGSDDAREALSAALAELSRQQQQEEENEAGQASAAAHAAAAVAGQQGGNGGADGGDGGRGGGAAAAAAGVAGGRKADMRARLQAKLASL